MNRDPAYSESYPQYMTMDAEREAEEVARAAGYPAPLTGRHLETLRAARLARARERISAGNGSLFDYVALGAAEAPAPAGTIHDLNEHLLAYRAAVEPACEPEETP